ncbi:MAG TPA: ubiquitin-like domain-containing protein [Microlunatus sp.]|nr:ubiquitin-like domain-containing protein [Microlunatus sp.]
MVAAGVTALAVAGGTFGYVFANKDVTLAVDGASTEVATTAGTVGEVLADRGITVGDRDVVAPGLDTTVSDGTRIAVQFARQVTVTIDGKPQTFWTTATNVDQALASQGIAVAGAKLSTSRSATIGRQGLSFDVATLKTITIKAGGDTKKVETTATTVGDALAAAAITPDGDDLISADRSAPVKDGSTVTFTKVDVKTVTKKESIAYQTLRKNSAKLAKGKTVVDQSGRAGSKKVTYREVRYDGKVKSTKAVKTTVTSRPTTRIVLIGTKSSSSTSGSGGSAPSVASGSVWDKLAQCESGGNWSTNTGNGYYGGLQFSLSTWRAYGGSGLPSSNSRERQIAIAKKVQAAGGWGQWPACSRKIGLR